MFSVSVFGNTNINLKLFNIMKTFLILFLLLISSISFSQIKVEVKDFSDDYFAVITIADTNDFDKPGVITVYDKKSNKNNLCNNIEIKFKRK
jgi:hypothetical protein